MTKEELAALIDGRQYGREITDAEVAAARAAGLAVAMGYSDDGLLVCGAAVAEIGARNGKRVSFGMSGEPIETRHDAEDLVREGWLPPKAVMTLLVEWCPPDLSTSWRITADVPYVPFDVMEDDELFCRGCVVDFGALLRDREDET